MTMSLTILGCGSSGGVPRVGEDWGACNPANLKNRRRRCSIGLQLKSGDECTTVVVDTSPDMREQMLSAQFNRVDGVWYSHEHADHTHGIDELRAYFLRQKHRIPVWADRTTAAMLMTRFAYCVVQAPGSDYPPILELRDIVHGREIETPGPGGVLRGMPFTVKHGNINALGFRIGNVAYTPDINGIPDASMGFLEGLDVWIVDALRPKPHPSHFSLAETLQWIGKLKPRRAILTNMHIDLDYDTLRRELPPDVEPAYDGFNLEF